MTIDCPHGFVRRGKLGQSIAIENRTVEIYGGVCDSPDRCGITTCRYYDRSQYGNLLFHAALGDEATLEGMLARQTEPKMDLDREHPRHSEAVRWVLAHRAHPQVEQSKPN